MPPEWWLSRLCEEFGCTPLEAYREWREAPAGLLEDIVSYRSYARAKEVYDRTDDEAELPRSAVMTLVTDIDMALEREAYDARVARAAAH